MGHSASSADLSPSAQLCKRRVTSPGDCLSFLLSTSTRHCGSGNGDIPHFIVINGQDIGTSVPHVVYDLEMRNVPISGGCGPATLAFNRPCGNLRAPWPLPARPFLRVSP